MNTERIREETECFDVFVSAFNFSDRIKDVFNEIDAERKIWLVHPEYQFNGIELPEGDELVSPDALDEVSQVEKLLDAIGDVESSKICIDITGFMRHVLIFLMAKLQYLGVRKVEVLYSEPMFYKKQEETIFSTTSTGVTRPIMGMAGSNYSSGCEFLVVGVGYDHSMISEVTNHKDNSIVYPVFGFPSLSPDMYQQSAIRSSESGEITLEKTWITNRRFAPANDPFSTARTVQDIVSEIDRKYNEANIYLSPLSTKVQTLGFALYWCLEGKNRGAVSLLMPECQTYSRETSSGLKRLWTYTVELDLC